MRTVCLILIAAFAAACVESSTPCSPERRFTSCYLEADSDVADGGGQ